MQRETVCILHYLSLDKEHLPILLNEGVYDIATKLGMHSDAKIKRSCKSILQLLSETVTSVNEGTVKRYIELSLSETDNTLDCRAPYSPQEACFEAIEGDSWQDAIAWMEEVSEGFRTATMPEMKALPFTTLGTEFKAPMWERVSWPTVPSEPDMPPSVVLKQENEDDVLKSKLTANPSTEARKCVRML